MFENNIKDLPKFSDIFIHESASYRKSAVEDHVRNGKEDPKHARTAV